MSKIYSRFSINSFISNSKQFLIIMLVLFNLNATSQVISFKNFSLESGTALSQGSVYRFSNVCAGNVDALVTVTELNRVTLVHIDSMFTGTDDGFQPLLSSTGGKGDHYAVFNVVFVTAGTTVPLNVVNFSGTFYDLNGNNQINEYASTTMENANWEYSNENPAVQVTQSGDTITGVSENNNLGQTIDTANKSNSFIVSATTLSAFTVKFGFIQDVNGWSGNDQFSLLFTGQSSTTILAVRLQNFNAQLRGDQVQLKWTTSMEENFSHFVVERSMDGKEFKEIAIVFANKNLTNSYQFNDDIKSNEILYYRLKMVDMSKHSQTSMIRIIKNLEESQAATIQAYPNPVVNELRISIPSSWQSRPVNYVLYSADGSVKKFSVNSANQTEVISMNGLNRGVYIVKVCSGNESVAKQIMKL